MKKVSTLIIIILAVLLSFGQSPEKFSYQAVIRNNANTLLINTNIGMQISILQGSATGTPVYVERHTATTNANGLVTLSIGTGTPVTGVFASINWDLGIYFIKTETDPSGGINYSITGTSQLLSVPYALYAKNVQNNDDADANPTNEIQNLSINGNQLTISQGNTVTLPVGGSGGDNWGSQVAMTDATLNGNGLGSFPLKIAQQGAASGQVLKWNGTSWLPADDQGSDGSNPTGPAGGDLSGIYPNPSVAVSSITSAKIADGNVATTDMADGAITTPKLADGSVNSAKIADGTIETADIAGNAVTDVKISDNAVQTAKIANSAVTGVKIAQAGATSGQVLKWNGTTWAPAADETGSGGSNPTGPAGGDLSGTYPNPSIGDGKVTGVKIAQAGAASGQVLKWNGTSWAPATDETGTGGSNPTGPAGGDLSGNYPNPSIGDGKVTTAKITASAITDTKLADNAVTSSKIADGAVNTSDIANTAVTVAKLPAGATASTYLRGDGTWATPSGGGSAPGGNDGNIQYKQGTTLAGSDNLTWNNSTNRLGIGTSTPSAYLEILHSDFARGLNVKSTQNSSTVCIDAKNGYAKIYFAKDGEEIWHLGNSVNDDFAIYEWTSATTASPRMRIIRNTGKAVFNETVEVRSGKGIIRSIDNVQRKTLSTTVIVNTTIAAGATTNISFTFPESFTTAPVAYIGNVTGGGFAEVIMSVSTVITTGGKLFIYNPKSTSQTPNFTVNIVALGQE